jgi:hypothetical protein
MAFKLLTPRITATLLWNSVDCSLHSEGDSLAEDGSGDWLDSCLEGPLVTSFGDDVLHNLVLPLMSKDLLA